MSIQNTQDVPQRSTETIERYRHKFLVLWRQARAERQVAELSPDEFLDWLEEKQPQWSKRTWWFYKAAVLEGFNQLQIPVAMAENARTRLSTLTAAPCPKQTNRTSAKKAKRLSIKDLMTLYDALMVQQGRWGPVAARWLIAGHATGLRPSEWFTAELLEVNEVPVLRVRNAKATNGRAHGALRHLLLHACDPETLAIIRQHVAECHQSAREIPNAPETGMRRYYHNCRQSLYRAAKTCFPHRQKLPTLYSARHQFAADLKKHNGVLVAAALMGHAHSGTVQRQYAHANLGKSRGGYPQSPADEIARVAQRPVARDVVTAIQTLQKKDRAAPTVSSTPTNQE